MERNEASFDLSGKKLFIGLPAYDFKISVKMAISLAAFCVKAQEHGVQIQMTNVSGCSVVSRARNIIADQLLDTDCTHLLFIDSDTNFEPEDAFRLLAFADKKDIVAGIAATRKKQKVYYSTLDQDEDGNIVMDRMGLVRVLRAGTGFMMIKREVFEKLREVHPEWMFYDPNTDKNMYSFFDFKSTPEGYVGEDYLFCDRAREQGFTVWVDPTIKLGHMGMHEFEGDFGNDFLYPLLKPVDSNKEAA